MTPRQARERELTDCLEAVFECPAACHYFTSTEDALRLYMRDLALAHARYAIHGEYPGKSFRNIIGPLTDMVKEFSATVEPDEYTEDAATLLVLTNEALDTWMSACDLMVDPDDPLAPAAQEGQP